MSVTLQTSVRPSVIFRKISTRRGYVSFQKRGANNRCTQIRCLQTTSKPVWHDKTKNALMAHIA